MRPLKMIDLYCGAGGAARGYALAALDAGVDLDITGVDLEPQPRYPFAFVQADARTFDLDGYDLAHGSPPCQDLSRAMRHLATSRRGILLDLTRDRFTAAGIRHWAIENVLGAPLPHQSTLFGGHGAELCGSMFGLTRWGLTIYRHRLFETSFPVAPPRGCNHAGPAFNPHSVEGRALIWDVNGRDDPERPWRETMGVGWMNFWEGRQAIPPAFTRCIGQQMIVAYLEETSTCPTLKAPHYCLKARQTHSSRSLMSC